ncbi:hypothetical protein GCM10007231_24050 [Nocardioides daphniae]|uniref:Uncharacterized protein n=1 Tax=Nocardioides daphniae TaxID=402297 RepID=A0ABQ1QG88_9ACTN|nr:hypothetical protein GCM10007231_24050 [Nocardioides daphniae]
MVGVGVTAWLLASPGAAHADISSPEGAAGGGETPGGYSAYAVRLEGDYSVSLAGRVSLPAPRCWWTEVEAPDPNNAEGVRDWFAAYLSSHGPSSAGGGAYVQASARHPEAFDAAVDADREGAGVTWYKLEYDRSMTPAELVGAGCTDWAVQGGAMVGDVPIMYNYFPFQTPRPPVVDVRVLAEYAYEVMNLVSPELDWNPKIAGRNNAALINLPTWMWVRDAEAVDTREVTASVGTVSVTVTAEPGTMLVRSEAGSASCDASQATTSYRAGRDESSACTVSFSKESYGVEGGFAVVAEVPWTASWRSGAEGGALGPRPRWVRETTSVPVSGSQALVTQVN